MRILLVDDEEIVHISLSAFLSDASHTVVSAKNGSEALAHLQNEPFDVILSDISMPVMDGLQLLQKVQEQIPGQPFVLMTGYGDEQTAQAALELGALECLSKPIGLLDLLQYLEGLESNRVADG